MSDTKPRENRANVYWNGHLLHDTAQAAAILNCRERWLIMQLRAGRFPARKVQRAWRMSDDDIAAAIEICAVTPPPPETVSLADQLTDRSRRAGGAA